MASQVDICNRALAAVGTRSTIVTLAENSNESNNCNLIYQPTREQLSRAANWNWCSKFATLSLLIAAPGTPENQNAATPTWQQGQAPPPPWMYEYAYPSDCLRMRHLVPQYNNALNGQVPMFSVSMPSPSVVGFDFTKFRVTTDLDQSQNPRTVILTNAQQAIAEYTADIDVPPLFDPDYEEALVHAMAGKLALALTGDKALAKLRLDMANGIIMQARATDGNEGIEVIDHTPDWIRTRGYAMEWGLEGSFVLPYGPLFTLPI